jgi:type IV pilus assembly protein PilM
MVAVDLGGSGIRAAQFKVSKGAPVITKVGFVPLGEGAVVGGEVKDVEAVGNALKGLWSAAKFSSKNVTYGVASDTVVVRIKTLDWDVEDDFRKSLKYQPGVAEDLAFDVDQANLDYHTLYEFTQTQADGAEQKMKSILLVAAEKSMVEQSIQAFRFAGLQPVSADLTPLALIRGVHGMGAVDTDPETIEVIIDMGVDLTNVILHQNGQPRFVRIVNGSAGRHLTRTLADAFQWSVEDAERTKIELGLGGGVAADGSQHPAQAVINHVISAFITEVRTSIDYFLSLTPQIHSVSRVVLTGGGTDIKGLKERIASELRVPVESTSPVPALVAKGVEIPEGLHSSQMSVVFGLATGTV